MAEVARIPSNNDTKQRTITVEGKVWSVVLPGAGTEMRFSQASRACKLAGARIALLDKKIDNGTITEEELDKYEEYSKNYEENEKLLIGIFMNVFKDGSKNNSHVADWMDRTPSSEMMEKFTEISSKNKAEESVDGQENSEEPNTQPAG
jgi:hypothetical protein